MWSKTRAAEGNESPGRLLGLSQVLLEHPSEPPAPPPVFTPPP